MKSLRATKEGGMHGMELLNELSAATGLPDVLIGEELSRIVADAGKTTESITLDELREMLASYLQDVLLDAKDSFLVEVTQEALPEEIEKTTVVELTPHRHLHALNFIDED